MNAAELLCIATAHGINLKYVAGVASKTDGIARKRVLTHLERKARRKEKLSMDVDPTASGKGSRTYRRPAWSIAELGQAAHGLPKRPWLAAQYSWAGDRTYETWTDLFWGLAAYADNAASREGWPATVRRLDGRPRPYVHELVQLTLEEQGDFRRHFMEHAGPLHAAYMNVGPNVWSKTLADPFDNIKGRYEAWLATARRAIQRRISGDVDALVNA